MYRSPDSRRAAATAARRLLVVDDEPTLRLGFAYALSGPETAVKTAGTGRQALEMLAAERFDLMVLDLRMPDIDGLGVIERLRNARDEIPIVLCSAALTPSSALRAIHCRVVDFLMKPVRPADLRSVIRFVLEPGDGVHYEAMKAARRGKFCDAIARFESMANPDARARAWLGLLRILRAGGEDRDEIAGRRIDHDGLEALAFRATPF